MYYFAYGSNMSESRMKAQALFTTREAAKLPGYRIEFNKLSNADPRMGFANIMPDPDAIVEGALYEVDEDAANKLDISEGYPDHYTREEIEVTRSDGSKVPALVYVATPMRIRTGLKPSEQYLRTLRAAKDILSKEYVDWLEHVETYDSKNSVSTLTPEVNTI